MGPALLLLSMLGRRTLRLAIDIRRNLRGNYIDGQAGGKAKLLPAVAENPTPEIIPAEPTLATTE